MQSECYSPYEILKYIYAPSQSSELCSAVLESPMFSQGMRLSVYLAFFAITVFIEAPVYFLALGNRFAAFKKWVLVIGLNLATHPLVSWFFPWMIYKLQRSTADYILFSEIFAPFVEMIILRYVLKLPWKLAACSAVIANVFSWWAGLYIAYALGFSF